MGASNSKFEDDPAVLDTKTWDYVIVGGGTAGCVLANRLSENPNVSVLLIEAGSTQTHPLFSRIPLAFNKLFKTEYDWNLETSPQSHLNDRKLYWPRGKMLGGSSSMNALMYHHCAPADFDEWSKFCTGDPSGINWSYDILQPYFLKAERFKTHSAGDQSRPLSDLKYRGTKGVWETRFTEYNEICNDAVLACENVGIPYTSDFNTPRGTLGTSLFPGFVDSKGERSSSATAYLKPDVLARKNLTVVIGTSCTRLLFSSSSEPTVTGVELATTDHRKLGRWTVSAKKEVILSAGAIATPHLLLLSGIGPRAELEKLGVEVKKECNDVGRNMIDHLTTGVSFRAAPGTSLAYLDSPLWGVLALVRWLTTGGGIYGSIAAQGAAFVRTDDNSLPYTSVSSPDIIKTVDETPRKDAPDVEILWLAAPYADHGMKLPPKGVEVFTMAAYALKPQSRGTIKLRSTDPFETPIIDPNYLSTESDMNVMLKALRLILRIGRAEPLSSKLRLEKLSRKSEKASPGSEGEFFWPGDADPDAVTDDDLKAFLKENCETIYHPVGTARMGTDPSKSVVSPSLRVHGVTGLRIVDASVFPTQLSGHPTAPIIAMSERMAEIIKST